MQGHGLALMFPSQRSEVPGSGPGKERGQLLALMLVSCDPHPGPRPELAVGSPSAGVNESPLMTWGEVENTPLRVEGSETPYVDRTPGPAFKVGHGGSSTGGRRAS